MSCLDELTLSIYADGELTAAEARHVATHLQGCTSCRALVSALERENVVLKEALQEEEAVEVGVAPSLAAAPSASSASSWLWGAVAVAACAPFLLDWSWQTMPSLPVGLDWLGRFGGLSGVYSLSSGLVSFIVGGQDMLVSSFGFVATLSVVVGALALLALQRPLLGASAGLALAFLASVVSPTPAQAAEFRFEEEGTVKVDASETIDDTVFLGGKTAIVAGIVDGDVFAGAERVEVTGTVHGNLYTGGESVTITGAVDGNVHAAGKNVELDTKIGGTGFLAGQNVMLTEASELPRGGFLAGESVRSKGRVGRDLIFAAEKMELSGNVERNVRGYGAEVSVSSGGSIGGDLHVTVPENDALEVDDGATVGGETTIEIHEHKERRAFMYPGFYFGVLAKALAMLLIGVLLVALFPSLRPAAPESSKEVLRDMGIGFVALIAAPVAMLIIASTLVGIPVSIAIGVVYALLMFLSTLVVAYFAGERLPAGSGTQTGVVLRTGLALLAILLVVEIPFVGGGLCFLIRIFGMGVLVLHLRSLYLNRQGPKGSPTAEPGVLAAG